ncbi:MAG: ABC-F family ATP-binding cassette domain-containing protein [Patescibacteria group bacterium]
MRNITVKGIEKVFGNKKVLSGVNFALSEGKRLAVVGENGSGKSTLLKILCGKIKQDGGEIFGLEFGCAYIPQDFSGEDQETPYDFLNRRVPNVNKITRLLVESGFDISKSQERLTQVRCGNLSGGEKKKLEIVAGLASGAAFLAMDEPENHLDYKTIEWLIRVLSKFRGGLIFVSHDQYFIDQLADTILELENGATMAYSMKYDEYLAEKERQVAGQARQWMMEEKTIKRLRKTVERLKGMAKRDSGISATYRQTKRRLQELKEDHSRKPTAELEKPKVELSSAERRKGKLIASVENLSFAYGNNKIFTDVNAELHFGEKVVLFGPNGSGKSTFVKLLTGELTPQQGSASIGINVRLRFMTQDHLAGIGATKSALEIFQTTVKWKEHPSRSYLAKYGIKTELVTRPLQVLSGGQQARFKLALIFAQNPEFLILDEPTNHVDPPTWEAIVEAINGYSGTVLAITHDRFFMDAITEKRWVIRDHKIQVELGPFSKE